MYLSAQQLLTNPNPVQLSTDDPGSTFSLVWWVCKRCYINPAVLKRQCTFAHNIPLHTTGGSTHNLFPLNNVLLGFVGLICLTASRRGHIKYIQSSHIHRQTCLQRMRLAYFICFLLLTNLTKRPKPAVNVSPNKS